MSESGSIPDLSGILSRVTENPQAMSMLASLLGGMSNASPEKKVEEPPEKEVHAEEEKKEEAKPVFLQSPRRGGRHEDKRRLLLALKPFLSKERQRALETLLPVLEAIALLLPGKEPPCT